MPRGIPTLALLFSCLLLLFSFSAFALFDQLMPLNVSSEMFDWNNDEEGWTHVEFEVDAEHIANLILHPDQPNPLEIAAVMEDIKQKLVHIPHHLLADLIWDEATESDDHIVPYRKGNEKKSPIIFGDHRKKQWNQESCTVKPANQNTSGNKTDFHGCKLESCFHFDTNEGLSTSGLHMDSWPDLPLPYAACSKGSPARNGQDSMGADAYNDLTKMTNINSARAERAQLDNEPELFRDEHEDKEHNDFLDYGWDNIGCFDDLDRIFRNDDPIFGCESLGNADELWSSSTDVINSLAKSFPLPVGSPSSGLGALRKRSEHYDIKTEFEQQEDQFLTPGCGGMIDPTSHGLQNVHVSKDEVAGKQCCSSVGPLVVFPGGKSKPLPDEKTDLDRVGKITLSNSCLASDNGEAQNEFSDKLNRQRKLLKCRKKSEEESEENLLQDRCGNQYSTANQFQQFGNQLATSMIQTFPSSVLSPQRQFGGPESLRYLHTSPPYLSDGYGSPKNHSPAMPLFPHIYSERDKHQPALGCYEFSMGSLNHANPLKKSPDAPVTPLTMTPQEKIEKLRRRQQMQAMLAIQKQQQQFSHQVSYTDHSITQKCPQENQCKNLEAIDIEFEENLSIPSSLEPNSPLEQNDSNTNSMVTNDCSLEETTLDQLQDVIRKLDIRISLCIRDSLFRLAQSAVERNIAGDTSSSNKSSWDASEIIAKEEINSQNRYVRNPDVERVTNHIDRTLAHLLFYRPLESSGRPTEIPESAISTQLPCEPKTAGIVNLSMGCLPESSIDEQNVSIQGCRTPCMLAEPQLTDQSRSSLYINTPEKASINEAEDGVMEVEASQ
ncbi:hypothetical protein HHK36_017851 [Tetracentron sinense]|uniref:Protein LNK2 n=1 Tax=Tetracentron sinense TaxID=13715 RepID=A0A834Z0E9_TETSI|nr:hypothetical protein HHK36_017851 [Tetracentron sinense]